MVAELYAWIQASLGWLLPVAIGLSILTVGATLVGLPLVLARMHPEHFLRPEVTPPWGVARVVRNVAGWLLIIAGIAMLVLPGQGLLTILAGLVLAEVPGKRRAQLFLLRRRPIAAAVDALRRRAGAAPLRIPRSDDEGAT